MRTSNIAMYSTDQQEPLSFSLGDKIVNSEFRIRSIVGLDAEDLAPRFYGFGKVSGSRFYDFGLAARDIVMRIVLRPRFELGESYSDVRDRLYRSISATRNGAVTLHFNAGATNVAKISGFITKFETALFNREPEVQLTVRCDDPVFRSITPVELLPEDIVGLAVLDYPNVNVSDTLSTAPHGFSADFVFSAASASFTIKDKEGSDFDWHFTVVPFDAFAVGDILHFSSEYGQKQLVRQRGGAFLSLIDTVQSDSVWPIIFPGENKLYFSPGGVTWNFIKYYASYWGV